MSKLKNSKTWAIIALIVVTFLRSIKVWLIKLYWSEEIYYFGQSNKFNLFSIGFSILLLILFFSFFFPKNIKNDKKKIGAFGLVIVFFISLFSILLSVFQWSIIDSHTYLYTPVMFFVYIASLTGSIFGGFWIGKYLFKEKVKNYYYFALAFLFMAAFFLFTFNAESINRLLNLSSLVYILISFILGLFMPQIFAYLKKQKYWYFILGGLILYLLTQSSLYFASFLNSSPPLIQDSTTTPDLLNTILFVTMNGTIEAILLLLLLYSLRILKIIDLLYLFFILQYLSSALLNLIIQKESSVILYLIGDIFFLIALIILLINIFPKKLKQEQLSKMLGPFPFNTGLYLLTIVIGIPLLIYFSVNEYDIQITINLNPVNLILSTVLLFTFLCLWAGKKIGYYLQWFVITTTFVIGILRFAQMHFNVYLIAIPFAAYELISNYSKTYHKQTLLKKESTTRTFDSLFELFLRKKFVFVLIAILLLATLTLSIYEFWGKNYKNRSDASVVWQATHSDGNKLNSFTPVASGNTIFYIRSDDQSSTHDDFSVYARNITTGELIWKADFPYIPRKTLLANEESLFLITQDKQQQNYGETLYYSQLSTLSSNKIHIYILKPQNGEMQSKNSYGISINFDSNFEDSFSLNSNGNIQIIKDKEFYSSDEDAYNLIEVDPLSRTVITNHLKSSCSSNNNSFQNKDEIFFVQYFDEKVQICEISINLQKETWNITLNEINFITNILKMEESVFVTGRKDFQNKGLMIDKTSGKILWSIDLSDDLLGCFLSQSKQLFCIENIEGEDWYDERLELLEVYRTDGTIQRSNFSKVYGNQLLFEYMSNFPPLTHEKGVLFSSGHDFVFIRFGDN